jgi:class 3 adenylate cyclase
MASQPYRGEVHLGFSEGFLVFFATGPAIGNDPMINCPRCQTNNRDNVHLCKECGQFLSAVCPNCGIELPDKAQFCDNCGIQLANLGSLTGWIVADTINASSRPLPQPGQFRAEQPIEDSGQQSVANALPPETAPQPSPAEESTESSTLHRFLPRELAAKLEAARTGGEMVGERRVVTMLFCDIMGSTAAAEQLDPEVWTEIINGAFEQMIRPIYKYEGTVARLMGDAILAFFGAPIAHEDDPVRAVLAGLDIIAGFDSYQEEVLVNFGLPINARVGIKTGLVVVGAVGSDLRMEYTAMGDAINPAARMEQTADPGTVQIAEETYRLIAPVFEVQNLGGVNVKGKAEPIETYRVVQRKAQPGRRRGIAGLETRLIGREWELAQLTATADRLPGGVGKSFCLVGEAGLGKSRLTREVWRHWQAASGADGLDQGKPSKTWHEAASFSYETLQPYALFQRLMRRMAGIGAGEAEDQRSRDWIN